MPINPPGTPVWRKHRLVDFIEKYGNAGTDEYVIKVGAGTTVKDQVYYLDTDNEWKLTDASSNVAGSDQIIAIAKGTNPTADGMMLRGRTGFYAYSHLGTTVFNYSPGKAIYVDISTGRLNTVAPTGSGQIVRVAGHCLVYNSRLQQSAQIYFNPEPGWLELV